jgi:hypothetical protein
MNTTLTLAGRKEGLVTDALSGLTSDGSITKAEKVGALQRIHDDVDARIEAIEAQIALESGESSEGEGEARHRYRKQDDE